MATESIANVIFVLVVFYVIVAMVALAALAARVESRESIGARNNIDTPAIYSLLVISLSLPPDFPLMLISGSSDPCKVRVACPALFD